VRRRLVADQDRTVTASIEWKVPVAAT
jgi:hypothetical protein